jgi:hypothetical protein
MPCRVQVGDRKKEESQSVTMSCCSPAAPQFARPAAATEWPSACPFICSADHRGIPCVSFARPSLAWLAKISRDASKTAIEQIHGVMSQVRATGLRRLDIHVRACVRACAHAHVHSCARARVRACVYVRACVRASMCVHAFVTPFRSRVDFVIVFSVAGAQGRMLRPQIVSACTVCPTSPALITRSSDSLRRNGHVSSGCHDGPPQDVARSAQSPDDCAALEN